MKRKSALVPENGITAAQCRAARALLGWTQERLAAAAEVNEATVRGFERGIKRPHRASLSAVRRALEGAGVEFIDGRGVVLNQIDQV